MRSYDPYGSLPAWDTLRRMSFGFRKNILHSYWSLALTFLGNRNSKVSPWWTTLSSCRRWDSDLGGSVVSPGWLFPCCSSLLSWNPSECLVSWLAVMHFWALYCGTVGPLQETKKYPANISFNQLTSCIISFVPDKSIWLFCPFFPYPPRHWDWETKYIVSIVYQQWGGFILVCSSKDTLSCKKLFSMFSRIFEAGMEAWQGAACKQPFCRARKGRKGLFLPYEKCKLQVPNPFTLTMSHLGRGLRPISAAVFWDKEFFCAFLTRLTRLGLSKVYEAVKGA